MKNLFAQQQNPFAGETGREVEQWERRARRDRFWKSRERRERERIEKKYGIGMGKVEEIELDGFGRAMWAAPQQPKRARVREWKMWSMP